MYVYIYIYIYVYIYIYIYIYILYIEREIHVCRKRFAIGRKKPAEGISRLSQAFAIELFLKCVGIRRDGISDDSGHFLLRHPFRHLTAPFCFCVFCMGSLHPVSITRFPLRIFSPGAGLLRYVFVHWQRLRFSRGWVRKDGNLLRETGCSNICCESCKVGWEGP